MTTRLEIVRQYFPAGVASIIQGYYTFAYTTMTAVITALPNSRIVIKPTGGLVVSTKNVLHMWYPESQLVWSASLAAEPSITAVCCDARGRLLVARDRAIERIDMESGK